MSDEDSDIQTGEDVDEVDFDDTQLLPVAPVFRRMRRIVSSKRNEKNLRAIKTKTSAEDKTKNEINNMGKLDTRRRQKAVKNPTEINKKDTEEKDLLKGRLEEARKNVEEANYAKRSLYERNKSLQNTLEIERERIVELENRCQRMLTMHTEEIMESCSD
ncbi:hypothetical protein AB6A40_000243 [Gnathostoma spinigerum]|uniref:Uncharacterized protein n=1 Tax=Gnathostoma spinigerum TaxID=75299 RepID=A0ABD6E842_9BILA